MLKYINLAFFILGIAFISFLVFLDQNYWNLTSEHEETKLTELAGAINNDFKSAVNGDAISLEPDISSYATKDVNLSHSQIVATKGKIIRGYYTDGNYEDVTTLIPNKWDNKLTELSTSINANAAGKTNFYLVAILMIVIMSFLIFANFIDALLNPTKLEKQSIPAPPLNHHKYFYLLNEEQFGPAAKKELEELLSSNKINSTTLIWCEGMNDWEELSKIF
jgi:hypothetical protein